MIVDYPAKKINHKLARVPDPTPALINTMVDVMYMSFTAHMSELLEVEMPGVDDISEPYRAAWQEVAKSAYSIIAIAGGATTTPIT